MRIIIGRDMREIIIDTLLHHFCSPIISVLPAFDAFILPPSTAAGPVTCISALRHFKKS